MPNPTLRHQTFPAEHMELPPFYNGNFKRANSLVPFPVMTSLGQGFTDLVVLAHNAKLPPGFAKLDGIKLVGLDGDFIKIDSQQPYMAIKMNEALCSRWAEHASGLYGTSFDATNVMMPTFNITKISGGDWSLSLVPPKDIQGYPVTPIRIASLPTAYVNDLVYQLNVTLYPGQHKHQFPDLPRHEKEPLYVISHSFGAQHIIAGKLQDGAIVWPSDLPRPDDHLTLELNPDAQHTAKLFPRDMNKNYLPDQQVVYVPLYRQAELYDAYNAMRGKDFHNVAGYLNQYADGIAYHVQGPAPLMQPFSDEDRQTIEAIAASGMENEQKIREIKQVSPLINDDMARDLLVVSARDIRPEAPSLLERCQAKNPKDAAFDIMEHVTLFGTNVAYKQAAVALSATLENASKLDQLRTLVLLRENLTGAHFEPLNLAMQKLHKTSNEANAKVEIVNFGALDTLIRDAGTVELRNDAAKTLHRAFTADDNQGLALSLSVLDSFKYLTQNHVKDWLNDTLLQLNQAPSPSTERMQWKR